jgi:GAF domain-containing protein
MKPIESVEFKTKDQLYKFMSIKLLGLIGEEKDWLANLSNASALLWLLLKDINWVGFYLVKEDELVLGPFQGKPACIRIQKGKGVCGTAWETDEVQLVPDVHDFPGHIACDSASASEIVLPIHSGGRVVAVLDIDSPLINRFDAEDQQGLLRIREQLEKFIDWERAVK